MRGESRKGANMRIIQKSTGETIFSIVGGERMTLDEAIKLADIHIIENDEDREPGYFFEDLDYITD